MNHGKRVSTLALCTGLFVAAASSVVAQDKKAAPAPPDQKAAMEAMQKAATPGEAHKKLDAMVGTWDTKVSMWMDPTQPPQVSTGTSENKWVLGNRYVEMQYQGTFMGQPFSGIGYQGYDNTTKKYIGTWMDTASTAMMNSTGTMTGNVMKASSMMADPMTGKMEKLATVLTVKDKDHHVMEMWGAGPDGKQVKMMEIEYTRKK
ncbi:MAG TPA: DUF1579 domain-containing protein [Thermoanaerobaculia bacterium]